MLDCKETKPVWLLSLPQTEAADEFRRRGVNLPRAHLDRRAAIGADGTKPLLDRHHTHGEIAGPGACGHRVEGTTIRPAMISALSASSLVRTESGMSALLCSSYTYPTPSSASPNW